MLASVSQAGTIVLPEGRSGFSNLSWYSRDGKRLSSVGQPGRRISLALSPDEKSAAIVTTQSNFLQTILIDLGQGTETRLLPKAGSVSPVWLRSGAEVVFSTSNFGSLDEVSELQKAKRSGVGEVTTLLQLKGNLRPTDMSQDGQHMLYAQQTIDSRNYDLWFLDELGKPHRYLQTPFNEKNPRFSPDGRRVSYTSDESGRDEVHIRSFPDAQHGGAMARSFSTPRRVPR